MIPYHLPTSNTDAHVERLASRLSDEVGGHRDLTKRLSRKMAQQEYGGTDSHFIIFRGKVPWRVWQQLEELGLAWAPSILPELSRRFWESSAAPFHRDDWIALHPLLGEAFMATLATAAAEDRGMEVVTDASQVHALAACRDEETIFRTLLAQTSLLEPAARNDRALTVRLAHLVIVGGFDVSTLTAKDLAKMSTNREALFDFREALGARVAEIPTMKSEKQKEAHLKAAAEEILDNWHKRRANMSRFAKRFFGLGLLDKSEKAMVDLAKAMVPGSLTTAGAAASAPVLGKMALLSSTIVAAAPGLAVALAIYGAKTWQGLKSEEMSGPLRYLSLLKKQGAALLVAAPPISIEKGVTGRRAKS